MPARLAFTDGVAQRLRESGTTVVLTGAGGWLGRATLEMLDTAFGDAFEERVRAYASEDRKQTLRSGRTIAVRALQRLKREPLEAAFVFHYAYLGKEKVAELDGERFARLNADIGDVLEGFCARVSRGGLFFASSGAAHYASGSVSDAAREPYGAAKLRDEARYLRLMRDGFPVVVPRIFNMSGPFINKHEHYALASMILDVLANKAITLRADHPVVRSYVHVRDVVDLACALLLEGAAPAAPFDTAGAEAIEIGALALRAAELLGRPRTPIVRPAVTGREDYYAGDGTAFRALLERMRIGPAALDRQILDTAEYLGAMSTRTS